MAETRVDQVWSIIRELGNTGTADDKTFLRLHYTEWIGGLLNYEFGTATIRTIHDPDCRDDACNGIDARGSIHCRLPNLSECRDKITEFASLCDRFAIFEEYSKSGRLHYHMVTVGATRHRPERCVRCIRKVEHKWHLYGSAAYYWGGHDLAGGSRCERRRGNPLYCSEFHGYGGRFDWQVARNTRTAAQYISKDSAYVTKDQVDGKFEQQRDRWFIIGTGATSGDDRGSGTGGGDRGTLDGRSDWRDDDRPERCSDCGDSRGSRHTADCGRPKAETALEVEWSDNWFYRTASEGGKAFLRTLGGPDS